MTPEQTALLDRYASTSYERSAIHDFLEWIADDEVHLGRYVTSATRLDVVAAPHGDLVDRYFGFDAMALEAARRALLDDVTRDQVTGKALR